jgi:hypothetical protein
VLTKVPLKITSGLPFLKVIVVTLPTGRDWWTDVSDFELLCQFREEADVASPLILDVADYFTPEFDGADNIIIRFSMTGSDTRLVTKSGYYDLVISDVGTTDARAYTLLKGSVKRSVLVSAEEEEETEVIP